MAFKGQMGGSATVSRTKGSQRRLNQARRAEEREWQEKSGKVEVTYTCVCERFPDKCRAH